MTLILALVAAAGMLGVFLWACSLTAGEIIYGEVDGDGPQPGAEKFPLIAAGAILAYYAIGAFLIS